MIMATSLLLGACNPATDVNVKETGDKNLIGKSDIRIKDGRMTPEALWAMGRIGGMNVSPDGKRVVYTVAYYSVPENKSNREVFVMNADGSDNKQITKTGFAENEAVWIKGGTKIAFLCNESGSSQLWEMNPDGTDRKRLSDYDKDIEGFAFSPDEKKVVFFSNVKYGQRASDIYPDLPKATGRVIDDLMYKHWDEWVEAIPHPFIADFNGSTLENINDILEGEPYEAPMKPFGGTEGFAWTPDSKSIAYTCRKKTGLEYSISTNSDIYLYDTETKITKNLTEGMMGYDTHPSFSPDGRYLAWMSMERDGYESDKNRLFVMDMQNGEKKYLTDEFDYSLDMLNWAEDGQSIYFLSVYQGIEQIFNIHIDDKKIEQITTGQVDYADIKPINNKQLIVLQHSFSKPDEIYSINLNDKAITELSFENKETLDQITMGKVEERWIPTTDNKKMLTWIIYLSLIHI